MILYMKYFVYLDETKRWCIFFLICPTLVNFSKNFAGTKIFVNKIAIKPTFSPKWGNFYGVGNFSGISPNFGGNFGKSFLDTLRTRVAAAAVIKPHVRVRRVIVPQISRSAQRHFHRCRRHHRVSAVDDVAVADSNLLSVAPLSGASSPLCLSVASAPSFRPVLASASSSNL